MSMQNIANGMRMACKLLCLEAIFQAQQGDSQYATDALLAGFYLADAFDSVPLMVDWLVQPGCRNLVISKLEQVMNTVRLTDEQLSNLIEYIHLILESESLRKVWITELGYNLAYPDDTYGHFTSPEVGFGAVDNMIFNAYDGLGFFDAQYLQFIDSLCNLIEAYPSANAKPAKKFLQLLARYPHHQFQEMSGVFL